MRIVPGRKYTSEQLARLVDQATADELQLEGYVLRHDVLDGMWSVVHWTHAGSGEEFGTKRKPRIAFDPNAFPKPALIKRRTPQERVDSLMLRFIDDCRRTGTVPGIDDERISFIVGQAWLTGRNEITAEVIQRVAQHFLADADKKFEAAEQKRVTRTTGGS